MAQLKHWLPEYRQPGGKRYADEFCIAEGVCEMPEDYTAVCERCGRPYERIHAIPAMLVHRFLEHFARHEEEILSTAQKSLKEFARMIGWWSERSIETAKFEWTELRLVGASPESTNTRNVFAEHYWEYVLTFTFWESDESLYEDVYGEWLITFTGPSVKAMRRNYV